jgi:DNA-binding NtrC family response regulator
LEDTTFTEDARHKRAQQHPPGEHLILLVECDRPSAGGVRVSLDGVKEIEVGRGKDRAFERDGTRLIVRVPDRWMSQAHARLRRAGASAWVLEDQGSRNGSIVAWRLGARHSVEHGDLIELGRTFFTLRSLSTSPAAPALLEAPGDALDGMATLLPPLADELAALARVSRSAVPVLLLGPTGSGKEVLARAVHTLSGRDGALVAVNCGALSANLVESQLFGHTKGAFSGALKDEPGFIRSAHKGTLFLDEIGDLPAASQASLLRVLQEKEVTPVGATRPVKVDLRVIAATHRAVGSLATRGEFRADLLARLAGHTHKLPPFAERREDIGVILAGMIRREGWSLTFTANAMRALYSYTWPLNVRELQQLVARAVALSGGAVDVQHLPPEIAPAELVEETSPGDNEARALKEALIQALALHKGNITQVAQAMNKGRTQIQRWLQRFKIDPDHYRE